MLPYSISRLKTRYLSPPSGTIQFKKRHRMVFFFFCYCTGYKSCKWYNFCHILKIKIELVHKMTFHFQKRWKKENIIVEHSFTSNKTVRLLQKDAYCQMLIMKLKQVIFKKKKPSSKDSFLPSSFCQSFIVIKWVLHLSVYTRPEPDPIHLNPKHKEEKITIRVIFCQPMQDSTFTLNHIVASIAHFDTQ